VHVSSSCVFYFWKVIAKVLGTAVGEYKDLRLDTMSALRKLITSSQEANNEDNVKEMSRFAKNYLPILFNLYTTKASGTDEEGQRLAAYETVKVLLCS
jgi:ribosomal RNA-processing protein 12